ncbi:PTS transporter subunit EIIC [Aeromonas caviae]|uniref:PTS transporter subunit EIIC n=1 Tax=Aeromonas caviae TaxID=648 RepID=UPI003F7B3079
MSKNYAALAGTVITALGGADNVVAVTHCMTRLRFVLGDPARVNGPALKAITGVLGVVQADNQCQVIIGNTVSHAYREVLALLPQGGGQTPLPEASAGWSLRRMGAAILDALIGTMSPLIPAIIGGSMLKLLAMVLEMTGVLEKGSSTLTILTVAGDGAFFFLPLMVAASAAVKFKTNMSLAIAIAGVLVHPSFIELMARAAEGEQVTFALVPVTAVKYTYTVIPALVMTWCLSYIEGWVDRITPAVTKNFLKPMLIVLIAAPLAILFIGPVGIWIGTAISGLVYTVHDYLGWLSVAIMGALWPLLVMTGMHRVFTPTIIQTIAETGKEGWSCPPKSAPISLLAARPWRWPGAPVTRNCARRRSRRPPPPLWRGSPNPHSTVWPCASSVRSSRASSAALSAVPSPAWRGSPATPWPPPGSLPACSSSIRPTP